MIYSSPVNTNQTTTTCAPVTEAKNANEGTSNCGRI